MSGWTYEQLTAHYNKLKRQTVSAEGPTAAPAKAKGRKTRKRPQMTEEAVQRQIIDLLEIHGWLVMQTNKFCGRGFSSQGALEPGMPDLQARQRIPWVLNHRDLGDAWYILWIEVKRPGGKVSTVQATWHQLAQRRGETVIVAENVETVAEAIGVKL